MFMTEQKGPSGGVTPHLMISGGRGTEAIAFYEKAFGAVEQSRHPATDGKRLMHAHLILNGESLMLHDEFPEFDGVVSGPPSAVTIHLEVDDADAWWKRAMAVGAVVRFPLTNQFWGSRYGQLVDPFGHAWAIGGPVKE
jgi:PhnB protein